RRGLLSPLTASTGSVEAAFSKRVSLGKRPCPGGNTLTYSVLSSLWLPSDHLNVGNRLVAPPGPAGRGPGAGLTRAKGSCWAASPRGATPCRKGTVGSAGLTVTENVLIGARGLSCPVARFWSGTPKTFTKTGCPSGPITGEPSGLSTGTGCSRKSALT